MGYVTEENFDRTLTKGMRDHFWRQIERAVSEILGNPIDVVERYRRIVEASPIGEQMLVYHESPLSIAADLTNTSWADITDDQLQKYNEEIEDHITLAVV